MNKVVFLVAGLVSFAGQALAQQPSPALAQTLGQVAPQLAPGQAPVSPVYGSFAANRSPVSFVVPLQGGSCYTFVGVGGMGVVDADMFLHDPSNKRVALDRRYDAWMHIVHCATFPGNYRVEMKVKRGAGEVAFQVFQAGAGAAPPVAVAPPPAPAPRAAVVAAVGADPLSAQLASLAAGMAPGMRRLGSPLAGVVAGGHPNDQYITLEGGRCYTFVSVSSPTVRQLNTYLWAPMTNKRVATDRSANNTSRLMHCAAFAGPYHFQAKADGGSGEFRTGVYVQ